LLKVLLPEKHDVRLHHVEQLAYDSRDASKMFRPEGSAQWFRELARFDKGLKLSRIDFLCIRRKDDRDTGIAAQKRVRK
jgi:hypothetical protein